jgi:hypothetical protein
MGRAEDDDAEIDCVVIGCVMINSRAVDGSASGGEAIGMGTGSDAMIGHATMRRTVDRMGWGRGGRGRVTDGAGPPSLAHSFGLSSDRVGAPSLRERSAVAPSVRHRATLEQAQRRLGIQPDGVDVPVHIGRRGLPTTLWWHLADVPCVSHQRTSTGKASRP